MSPKILDTLSCISFEKLSEQLRLEENNFNERLWGMINPKFIRMYVEVREELFAKYVQWRII